MQRLPHPPELRIDVQTAHMLQGCKRRHLILARRDVFLWPRRGTTGCKAGACGLSHGTLLRWWTFRRFDSSHHIMQTRAVAPKLAVASPIRPLCR